MSISNDVSTNLGLRRPVSICPTKRTLETLKTQLICCKTWYHTRGCTDQHHTVRVLNNCSCFENCSHKAESCSPNQQLVSKITTAKRMEYLINGLNHFNVVHLCVLSTRKLVSSFYLCCCCFFCLFVLFVCFVVVVFLF